MTTKNGDLHSAFIKCEREEFRARMQCHDSRRAPGMQLTAKPHHTGRRFRNNYVPSVTRTLPEVLRWQFQRIKSRLPPPPTIETPRVLADLEFISSNARAGEAMIPAVTWVGHASMLVQASGLNVLTDPIFSVRASSGHGDRRFAAYRRRGGVA